MNDDILSIMEYVKSTKLKGHVEIIDNNQFTWDLDNLYLRFLLDNGETTIVFSKRKNQALEICHFHKDNSDVIHFIQAINDENKRIHITCFFGSFLRIEDKTKKQKRSCLFVRHYYSEL